jgi:C4-dicarboxylate-specific signal transduction histidine kinase
MKCGKKIVWINAAAVLMMLAIVGQPTVATAQQWSVQSEEAAHPRLAKAIHELKEALREMERAPDEFGGNKAAAIRDTRVAIHSLKKALYYRLRMDDAAIDRIP